MARAHVDYRAGGAVSGFVGHNPDVPEAGFYRMRLRSGGALVGVHIWFGVPLEPWTGEEMDRAPRWNATINGRWAEVGDVWPRCAGEPVTEAECGYLAGVERWARQHAPDSPLADPRRRIDPLTSPLLF